MDFDTESNFQERIKFFNNISNEESQRSKRSEAQIELRRSKRSEASFRRRKLKEFELDWIEIDKCPSRQFQMDELEELISLLHSPNKKLCLMGVYGIRKLLSQGFPSAIDRIMSSGAVGLIVACLSYDDSPQIQYEAAWAITNICTGSHQEIWLVIEQGCLAGLVHMLTSSINEVKEQALWALGNIAADSGEHRDLILEAGVVQPLVGIIMNSQAISLVKQGCWTACNICRAKPRPVLDKLHPLMPALAKGIMLHKELQEIVPDILWSFGCLTENNLGAIDKVIELELVPVIIGFARSKASAYTLPALKVIGNVIGGNDRHTDAIVEYGGIKVLKECLGVEYKPVKKEAVWAISNLCAGTSEQLDKLLRSNILRILAECGPDENLQIQKEIVWAFANAVGCGYDIFDRLLEQGIFACLVPFLHSIDSSIVLVALMAIDQTFEYFQGDSEGLQRCLECFEENNGDKEIYKLQNHPESRVYKKALKFLETYLDSENEYQSLVDNVNELAKYNL